MKLENEPEYELRKDENKTPDEERKSLFPPLFVLLDSGSPGIMRKAPRRLLSTGSFSTVATFKKCPVLVFGDLSSFSSWLRDHEDSDEAVYLAIGKKGCRHRLISYPDAREAALCWGWIDGHMKRVDDDHYLLRVAASCLDARRGSAVRLQ